MLGAWALARAHSAAVTGPPSRRLCHRRTFPVFSCKVVLRMNSACWGSARNHFPP